jgi:purine nucleoside permease
MRFRHRLTPLLLLPLLVAAAGADEAIRPKVVVVTMFEPGAATGDAPGELQFWVEREKLERTFVVPGALHEVHASADGAVLAMLTGVGNTNAAASVMAVGLDPRFDFSRSYWLVAGIAGIDPADGSIGSAVWANYVVDGDLTHEIDAREMPADWTTGYVPLGRRRPYEAPTPKDDFESGNIHALDAGLVLWAWTLTRDTPLIDNDQMRKRRATYTDTPAAQRPPAVLIGANLASSNYWHGKLLNERANRWVSYYSGGKANYVTTAMEDSGTLRALANLGRAGKVDPRRVLVLRTASNFDMQWPGGTAAESMNGEQLGIYTAYLPSLEAAYRVGSRVVHALLADWTRYESTLPHADAP